MGNENVNDNINYVFDIIWLDPNIVGNLKNRVFYNMIEDKLYNKSGVETGYLINYIRKSASVYAFYKISHENLSPDYLQLRLYADIVSRANDFLTAVNLICDYLNGNILSVG